MLAVAINAPNYPQRGYRSLLLQLNEFSAGVQAGSIAQILGGAIGAIMLLCRSPASPAATCGCVGT